MKNELDITSISKLYKEISSVLRTARTNSPAASTELTSIIPIPNYNIISRKSGQKIQKIANLQYYKSKANYGTKKKGISR